MDRKDIKELLQNVRPKIALQVLTKMLQIRYFGHVTRANQSLDNAIMLGITAGTRKKGKPRTRRMEDIKIITGHSVNDKTVTRDEDTLTLGER